MRLSRVASPTLLLLVPGAVSLTSFLTLSACKVEHEVNNPDADTSQSQVDASEDGTSTADVGPADTTVSNCMLSSNAGTDPVDLCFQKKALEALHTAAFDPKKGVATSWSYQTTLPDTDGGVTLHTWQDDVAYASDCARYHANAAPYGDNTFTPTADADLLALAPLIEKELAPLPAQYEGDDYARLRSAASGLLVINDLTDGKAVNTIADAYARQIYATYFHKLATPPAPDAGTDAATDSGAEGGPGDGGIKDGGKGDAAPPPPTMDGIIGRPSNGAYAYVTADVATAALALLDMAARNPTDPNHLAWQEAAQSAFDHIYNHARDPITGLYYTALVTSSEAGLDAFDPMVADAATMYSDTTATVALALAHAQGLVNKDMANNSSLDAGLVLPVVASYPFSQHVDDAIAALNNGTQSLYDGPAGDAGATSTGFMEGYAPGKTPSLLTNKTTRANAYALAVLHLQFNTVGTHYDTEILPLTQVLTDGTLPNTSLVTVVPLQEGFFRAGTKSFGLVTEPFGSSYQTAAVTAFIEGMSELLPPQQ
jgi:hypothetical protein